MEGRKDRVHHATSAQDPIALRERLRQRCDVLKHIVGRDDVDRVVGQGNVLASACYGGDQHTSRARKGERFGDVLLIRLNSKDRLRSHFLVVHGATTETAAQVEDLLAA